MTFLGPASVLLAGGVLVEAAVLVIVVAGQVTSAVAIVKAVFIVHVIHSFSHSLRNSLTF